MLINGLGIGVPYKTFRGAGETLNQSSLYLPLKSTIVPSKGTSTPTFTRATAAWSFDNEGKLNLNIPSGCVRFKGGRLVRNQIAGSSEDFANASWTKQRITYSGGKFFDSVDTNTHRTYQSSSTRPVGTYSFFVEAKASELTECMLTISNGVESVVHRAVFNLITGTASVFASAMVGTQWMEPLEDGWWRCYVVATIPTSTTGAGIFINTFKNNSYNYTGTGTDGFFCRLAQWEYIEGQANQTASEYVSVGVLSSPYHGAGVDGCKWFPTNKDGSAIPSSTLEGYLAEPSRTNNCFWNRDLTNIAWTNTNITAAKTATGLDNVANSATRLTAAATDATITQLLTAATGTRTLSAYIKRVSGTGTISLTRDGGTGWTDITSSLVTGSWVLVKMTSDVGANPTVGIKMGTSGDVIDVDCVQDENGAWATSPILTTTAAVTRNGDVLSYASAFDVAQGTSLCSVKSVVPSSTGQDQYALNGDSSSARIMYWTTTTNRNSARVYDGLNMAFADGLDITTGVRKRSSRWGANLIMASDGILGTSVAFDGSMGIVGTLYVGSLHTGISQLSGTIREVHIWPTPLTDAQMKQVTT